MECKGSNGLTVEVNVKMTVDEKTANACLKIVEIFVNQTGREIISQTKESGEVELNYEPN